MAGVAGVKVAPERRGSGIGHALVAALLAQIAARGYPLSALYPATARLYRPLGWELAGGNYLAVVPARSLQRFTPPQTTDDEAALRPRTVHVRRATADDADTVLSVLGAAHRSARDCGPLTRDAGTVARWLADPSLYAYLAPDGFLAYRWHGGNGEILVERAVAASAGTTRALWLIVASHASVAGTVRARVGPQDPFWWLTAEPDADVARRGMWMLRVVDAPAAVAARGFPLGAELAVRLRIHDRQRPGNDGRWRLSLAGGAGTLVPSHDVGDALALSARGFAALYAGTPVAALRRAGLAASGDPDADAAVDAAFAGAAYMLDSF